MDTTTKTFLASSKGQLSTMIDSSGTGGDVCVPRISCVCWCGFSFDTFDLWISCWPLVVDLIRSIFVSLAHNDFLFNLSNATSYIGQLLPDSNGGGARTAACFRLVLMSIVVARWCKDLFCNFN
jgi:hypothetical protein